MKKFSIFCLGLFFSINLFAQADNWYFSLSMGSSMPINVFKQMKTLDEKAGFAENGFALSLDASYPVGDHWALKGLVMLNSNPVNRSGMGTMLEERMNEYFTVSDDDRDNLTLTVNSWLTNSMVFGPVFTINFDQVYWDFQALGGLNMTYLPKQKLAYENPDLNWMYLQRNTSSASLSFGLLTGTALRFALKDNLNLRVAVDYFRTTASVKYEELRLTKEGSTIKREELSSGKVTNPIETVSGTIGLVYYL